MNEEWLIDGYNLLYYICAQKDRALPCNKNALTSVLAGMASAKKQSIVLVLDGVGSAEELEIYQAPYFRAEYSQKVSADHFIERHLYLNKSLCSFLVVTDDRTISSVARGSGARVLKNSQFLEMIRTVRQESDMILFKEKTRQYGFNRPFDEKLKDKGL